MPTINAECQVEGTERSKLKAKAKLVTPKFKSNQKGNIYDKGQLVVIEM